jgi:DNA invertase Pin-like site-specific DNA recombinase
MSIITVVRGLAIRKGQPAFDQRAQIMRMFIMGWEAADIAKHLGLTYISVYKRLRNGTMGGCDE